MRKQSHSTYSDQSAQLGSAPVGSEPVSLLRAPGDSLQSRKLVSFFSLVVIVFALPFSLFLVNLQAQFQHHAARAAGNSVTFTPAISPLSNPDIGNSLRGPQYYGNEQPPPNWPLTDRYQRWCWKDIEPTEGNYNWPLIDGALAQAKAAGYKFGFRIMPWDGGDCIPDYLKAMLPKGFYQNGAYVPDYNDPNYLARAQALFTALGNRYNNDPRLGLMDMSLYGCWGEWHPYCGISYPSATGAVDMTAANRQALIDMQVQALSNKRFLMVTYYQDSLDYALNLQRPQRIGVRIDCLGRSDLGSARQNLDANPIEHNQWQVAPLYFEYCSSPDFSLALQDIKTYHASIIGDGANNINGFSSYSTTDQNLMMQDYEASGYRFELNSLTMSAQLTPGGGFTVTTQWTNVNTAPAYNPWNVMVQLRDSANTVVWQGKSSLDLQVPFTSSSPGNDTKTVTDNFMLPGTIANGTYTLALQITDANNYYAPLTLANQGRQADGSYALGTVTIGGTPGPTSSVTPTPTAATTPTPTAATTPTTTSATATSGYAIYQSGLSAGWSQLTNQGSANLANTSPALTGKYSIAWTANAWGTFALGNPQTLDVTPYGYLHFALQAGQANAHYAVQLVDTRGKGLSSYLLLANYGGDPQPEQWKTYDIPLTDLKANGQQIQAIGMQNYSGNGNQRLYIDDVKFVATVSTPTSTSSPTVTPTSDPPSTATATPLPSQTYSIYNGGLAPGWEQNGYESSVNLTNSTPNFNGKPLIAWTSDAWGTFSLGNPQTVNTGSAAYLHFAAQGGQANSHYAIQIIGTNGMGLSPYLLLADYGGDPVPGQWKVYNIPLAALGAAGKQIEGITIQNSSGNSQQGLYLDDISFQ